MVQGPKQWQAQQVTNAYLPLDGRVFNVNSSNVDVLLEELGKGVYLYAYIVMAHVVVALARMSTCTPTSLWPI